MRLKKGLLIVDVQNDFCPGGKLAVPKGDKVVPRLNRYIRLFLNSGFPIFASRDWHPKKSSHFKRYGGQWPIHCVQRTKGAKFHPALKLPSHTIVISKGMNPKEDSYSAFQAVDNNGTDFLNVLKMFGVDEIFVGGLATDYCVKYSVLDALRFGLKVRLLVDAIRGVDLKPGDSERAIREMVLYGAKKTTFEKVKFAFATKKA